MRSLTVTEARTRAASISVTSYDLDLDLTRGDTHFGSRAVVEFESRDRQDTWADLQADQLVSAHLNGRRIDPSELVDGRLHLHGLADHNDLVVEALMRYSRDGEGLHRSVDPEDKQVYLYAMAFLSAAPRIYACFDQPDLKACYRVAVTAPDDWQVIGNGRAEQVSPGRWQLAETKPLATYFATLVAGPYHVRTAEHDGITLGLACRASLAEHLDKDADELFEVTAQCFDEYHRLFGIRYPFGDYFQVFCPDFNAGAMENPGCITVDDNLVFKARATDTLRASRACLIAHEMAHQWFGDLVTMTWWDDLWLNESFAEYMGYRVTHDVTRFSEVWAEFAYSRKAWGMAADQRTSTHPIAGNGARNTQSALSDFDGISYAKGASALRQLQAYLGEEAFLRGVVDHLTAHSYGNARLADLLAAWSRASDRDVPDWAAAWLQTSGLDTLSTGVRDGVATISRTGGSTPPASRPHAVTAAWYQPGGHVQTADVVLDADQTLVPFEDFASGGFVLPDSRDQTWAKLQLDDNALNEVGSLLAGLGDPLARAVIWGALREGVTDCSLDPDRFLGVVERALPTEGDLGLDAVFKSTTDFLGTYLTAPEHARRVAAVADQVLSDAAPDSNRQLVAARVLIRTTDDADRLRSWLDGDSPDGLARDSDLRWRLTRALCEAGDLGIDDIEGERNRDPSSQGHLHALECRAALPTADTKDDVWRSITTDDSLSNHELYALGAYFFRAGQRAVVQPYVARYFTDIPATASMRTGWVVERLADAVYPRCAADPPTLEAAEAAVRADGMLPGVKRAIADATDDLRRAVRSRQRFGR